MKSSLGDLRRQVDLVLKSEIRRHGAVFREWKAQGIVEELDRSVFPGGKRVRPVLCCLAYQAAGGRLSQKIVRAAASLELLHTFALIHDDIMDASPERRGGPSAYRRAARRFRSGEGINEPERRGLSAAVLAGDLALVLSDRLFVESGFDAADIARAWEPLTRMRLEAIGGQYLDLVTRGAPVGAPGAALRIAALKTAGYSVKGPLLLGAQLGGATAGALEALSVFGEKVGIAFQLADDLAGLLGDPAVTGKDAEADARRGSPTRLIAQTMQMASPSQRKAVRAIWGNPRCTAADLGKIRALVVETGAVGAAVEEIKSMVEEASARLGHAHLRPVPVRLLSDLAGSIAAAAMR